MPGLEDLYREIILDHYRTPRNRGELEPPAVKIDGHNPLCGDEISVYLAVDRPDGSDLDDAIVTDIKIGGQGCSISQSSASMMTKAVMGKSVGEINAVMRRFKSMMGIDGIELEATDADVDLGELEALQGVVKFPVRIKCAVLSWNTLANAIVASGAPADDA
ncbi:MAG: SUF system NifU family Fe-S cluster assembly protein [Ilumatobacter sp.]|uniref:Fe-S cluster assembly sulfur transfer protein SufU n=1 Tax=Ilumatobacter sp. TaxID=1967498 RepID=UPI003C71C922